MLDGVKGIDVPMLKNGLDIIAGGVVIAGIICCDTK